MDKYKYLVQAHMLSIVDHSAGLEVGKRFETCPSISIYLHTNIEAQVPKQIRYNRTGNDLRYVKTTYTVLASE